MRAKITITDDQGQTFEGEVELATTGTVRRGRRRARATPTVAAAASEDGKVDFGLPLRAFLKKHANGGGPRKFALLVAHLTGGKTGVEVTRDARRGKAGPIPGSRGGRSCCAPSGARP